MPAVTIESVRPPTETPARAAGTAPSAPSAPSGAAPPSGADETAAPDVHAELARAREKIQNLEIALTTSRRIGIALGILMASRRLSETEAFDMLRRVSQSSHRKLRDIADDLVYTGELPAT